MNAIHSFASVSTVIVTLLNVVLALFSGSILPVLTPALFNSDVPVEIPSLFLKIVLFFYLELAISLSFAYIKFAVIFEYFEKNPGFYSIALSPVAFLILLASAWTSLFNIEWIFIDGQSAYSTIFSFQTLIIFVGAISATLIMWVVGGYIEGLKNKKPNSFDSATGNLCSVLFAVPLAIVIFYKYVSY